MIGDREIQRTTSKKKRVGGERGVNDNGLVYK